MWFHGSLLVILVCSTAGSSDQPPKQENEVQLHPSVTPRRGRFLGLLGLLTGLTLVDSLDDGDGPARIQAPTGIVKINIGRPFMESFYHQYAYANPYYYGTIPTINIKIPLRPDGHEGLDGFGFGGGGGVNVNTGPALFPGQGGSSGGVHFGHHSGQNLIEPRPQFADEQVPEVTEPSEKKIRKTTSSPKSKRSKLSTTRIVRSTARSDLVEDQTGEASENQLEELVSTTTIPTTTSVVTNSDLPASSSTEEPLVLHATAIPVIEDTQASLPIPQSYYVHPGNHQLDVESISLTSTASPAHEGREFKPSRPDKLLNYYSSSLTAFNPDEFRPVAAVG